MSQVVTAILTTHDGASWVTEFGIGELAPPARLASLPVWYLSWSHPSSLCPVSCSPFLCFPGKLPEKVPSRRGPHVEYFPPGSLTPATQPHSHSHPTQHQASGPQPPTMQKLTLIITLALLALRATE